MATLEEEYQRNAQNAQTQGVDTAQLQGGSYDQINQMYDAQKQAQLSGLEQAYNQQRSNAQAARDELPGQYQARANDLAVQYERNRRNLNEQAAANGINTGAGSQMQLALNSNFQRDYGGIRTAEQKAIEEADRNMRDMEASYQSAVQQAVADNDYKRAQALLAEYQQNYSKQLQQAQTLASYGDFSAYLNVPGYTQAQVDSMRNSWIAANPDMAYNTGAITAEQYKAMTGSWPAGYTPKYTYYEQNPQTPPAGGDGVTNPLVPGAAAGLIPAVIPQGAIAAAANGSTTGGTSNTLWDALRPRLSAAAGDAYLMQQVAMGNITPEAAEEIKKKNGGQ